MSEIPYGVLEKIDDYRWRIPKSFKPGMRVPGIIYANEKLLKDIYHDKALEQVANVAFLPGIVNASLAMPDIHWGYGFSIGGVGATDIEEGGVISPAGVGYDINCLSASSLILNEFGYKIKIKDYEHKFHENQLICMDFGKEESQTTKIVGFLKQKPKHKVLCAFTESQRLIEATSDHPFYTDDGMKELGKLLPGDKVAIYPFEGVEYEEPNQEVLVSEEGVKKFLVESGMSSGGKCEMQILRHLNKQKILPLKFNSCQFPYLLKIIGYCFGDGLVYFTKGKRNRGTSCFYGTKKDLERIKEDLAKIGFRSSIYSRDRHHKIKTMYATTEFDRKEYWLKVASKSFAVLLAVLGVPLGNKCRQDYKLPRWLFKAPLWQKRLFLAGLFGAELSSPKTMTGHGYNF
ncbi:RNA-splicing ligase RtcB, partial [bacterium]